MGRGDWSDLVPVNWFVGGGLFKRKGKSGGS
jgi:hypothetical protein